MEVTGPAAQAPLSQSAFNLSYTSVSLTKGDATLSLQKLVLEGATSQGSDSSSLDFSELYKSLSITGQQIVDKLNELLKAKLPGGLQSLKPEDVTPEATADRIVKGATAFFDVFSKQNPDLEGQALVDKFIETISSGIDSGYDDAYSTLDDLGAFEFDGVKEGVEKTKDLITQKLAAYREFKLKELGVTGTDVEGETAEQTKTEILKQVRIAA